MFRSLSLFLSTILSILALVLVAGLAQAGVVRGGPDAIPGQYIVVLSDSTPGMSSTAAAGDRRRAVGLAAREMAADFRGQLGPVFSDSLRGFAVGLSRTDADALARDPRVAYVVEDQWVQGASSATQFNPPSWGLDRVDQREASLDGLYEYLDDSAQSDVHVYVIDSGIHYTHQDFGGRVDVINAFNPYTDGYGVEGCHGHGTHVAGTIGGETFGVAKGVTLHPVRVLNCWNGGPLSAVIAGVEWVTARMLDEPHAAIANMSLMSTASQVLDDAVRTSIAAGVTYVVAAGNASADACNYSPARVAEAITVGASDAQDALAAGSNTGACVDLYAPGSGIVSAYNRSDSDSVVMSGTSMAAAHVSGIAATLLAQNADATPAELTDLVIGNATELAHDIDPTGNPLLAFSLVDLQIEPEPEIEPVSVDFLTECNPRNWRCKFEGRIDGNSAPVDSWIWDFGDGSFHSHHRHVARHGFARDITEVTVMMTVLLESGETYTAEQVIQLDQLAR